MKSLSWKSLRNAGTPAIENEKSSDQVRNGVTTETPSSYTPSTVGTVFANVSRYGFNSYTARISSAFACSYAGSSKLILATAFPTHSGRASKICLYAPVDQS